MFKCFCSHARVCHTHLYATLFSAIESITNGRWRERNKLTNSRRKGWYITSSIDSDNLTSHCNTIKPFIMYIFIPATVVFVNWNKKLRFSKECNFIYRKVHGFSIEFTSENIASNISKCAHNFRITSNPMLFKQKKLFSLNQNCETGCKLFLCMFLA